MIRKSIFVIIALCCW